jgi:hypothetical protein
VDPIRQGRAAGLYELEMLLAEPASEVQKVFDTALREQKKI